jgi:hypothetical protein
MSFKSFHFTFEEVCPTFNEILDFLQSADLEEEHPAVIFIRDILPELHYNTGISGGYVIKENEPIDIKEGTLKIDNSVFHIGKQICRYIKESSSIALFLCTAGDDFTRITNQLNEQGDVMEAYILDAIGSLTVEKAMDKIMESLRQYGKNENLKISNRYSPGYCNWHLSEQKALFDLIGNNSTGVTLNDSCLMSPTKSVSGIIGIGKNLKHHEYGCKICTNVTCIYRKILHE